MIRGTTMLAAVLIVTSLSQAQASPKTPYLDKKGKYEFVVIKETEMEKYYLSSCSIHTAEVKYLGKTPICHQTGKCTLELDLKSGIAEPSVIDAAFNCQLISASDGCRSKTWKDCALDPSLPDELDPTCLSDAPRVAPTGCASVESSNPSTDSTKGSRLVK